MQILGWEINLTRKATPGGLSPVWDNPRAWWPIVREPFAGAWQRNMEERPETILAHPAVFRCNTIIASDIAKLRPKLMRKDRNGIWEEEESPAFSPVLKIPNHYQNPIQFLENWVLSKMIRGNTYVLKHRDDRDVVVAMYVLDPNRVTPLVGPPGLNGEPGEIFYQVSFDNLSGIPEGIEAIPASEIIHDRFNCLFHPLVGLSPLYASGLSALQGLKIQTNSAKFFSNGALPSGILSAPARINDENVARIKKHWEDNYRGDNAGKVAVLGDGMKFERMVMTSVDSQLIEQLKWTAEAVCMAYGVPAYKIGAAPIPALGSVEAVEQTYYSQCLQILIESIEACLDQGLGLLEKKSGKTFGIELDIDNLLRMDSKTLVDKLVNSVGAGIESPNEARKVLNRKPVKGGESPLAQQQNFTLAALAARKTAPGDPADAPKPAPEAVAAKPPIEEDADNDNQEQAEANAAYAGVMLRKLLRNKNEHP